MRNGLCSLIVAVPQSEAWHWCMQPRNVTLIRLGTCSGLLIVEHEPSGFRPSWLQIGVPGQVRRGGPVPLPKLPPPYQVLLWSGIWRDHLGNFSDHSQRRCGRAAVGANFTPYFLLFAGASLDWNTPLLLWDLPRHLVSRWKPLIRRHEPARDQAEIPTWLCVSCWRAGAPCQPGLCS